MDLFFEGVCFGVGNPDILAIRTLDENPQDIRKEKTMKKSTKNVNATMILNSAAAGARKEAISNGTWMGRPCVHRSKKAYNRQKSKIDTRRMADY